MQLIKLVIELSDHLLDAARLLFLIQLVVDCILDVFICVLPLRFLSRVWLVFQYFRDFGGCVLL
jgi:hypothetical protein